jgi:predicted nucleic acid-binding Zn ribbon protein
MARPQTKRDKEYARQYRAKLIADGTCVLCRKRPIAPGNKTLCAECREVTKEKSRQRYKQRKAAGLCTKCGKKPLSPESKCLCEDCLAYDRQRYINWHGRGGVKKSPSRGVGFLLARMKERLTEDEYNKFVANRTRREILDFVAKLIKDHSSSN